MVAELPVAFCEIGRLDGDAAVGAIELYWLKSNDNNISCLV